METFADVRHLQRDESSVRLGAKGLTGGSIRPASLDGIKTFVGR